MTLPQVEELFDYWKDHPPTHELMAASVGFKRKPESGYLPCTRISPILGEIPGVGPTVKAPSGNLPGHLTSLAALAARRGGGLRPQDL